MMSTPSYPYAELDRRFPGRLKKNVLLSEYTTFQIGGPADRFVTIRDAGLLAELLAAARELRIPAFLLGEGSNLLIDDAGLRGLVIHDRMDAVAFDGRQLRVEAGAGFHSLILSSVDHGLSGLEFAAGIPGTVGGAVWGNAGCYGRAIGDFLLHARWIEPDGHIREVGQGDFEFEYRESILKHNGCVLIDLVLELFEGEIEESHKIIEEKLELRRRKHPQGQPCAGSYFKNLPPAHPGEHRIPAGKLLDEVGAKSFRVGDAAVFEKHANIIVNLGQASAKDVLALASQMKRRVREEFGVELGEEVSFIGENLRAPSTAVDG